MQARGRAVFVVNGNASLMAVVRTMMALAVVASIGMGLFSGVQHATASGEHWIDVDRNDGQVTLFVGDEVYAVYWGSLSYDSSDGGFYSTASGTYYVYSMYEPLSYSPYADNYITDWVGFDPDRSNGFHSWTRDASGAVIPGGSGPTAGCVALEPSAAEAVYAFSFIGMRVEVHN